MSKKKAMFFKQSVSIGTEAQDFIDAVNLEAGLTLTSAQEVAIDDLVVGLKANGTWAKYHAIYPFIGGTATSHKWNLKNPLDTDGAFRLTFNGTITHDANGITGDGSTGYANTHLIPASILTAGDTNMGIYSRTNDSGNDARDMGVKTANGQMSFHTKYINGNAYVDGYDTGISGRISFVSQSFGMFHSTRRTATDHKVFIDGIEKGFSNTDTSADFANITNNIFLGNFNDIGVPNASYSARNYAFSVIGDGLTDTEVANDYTVIQAYQTALGRNV